MIKKRKESPYMEKSRENDQKSAFVSNQMQLLKHSLCFFRKDKSLPPATSILSCSPTAHDTTASLDNLTCTDYVDFSKCQDRF